MIPLLLAAALATADKPVLSVVYFDNNTGRAELDVLRKGFADLLITDLVGWDGVTVVEREKLEAVLTELELQQTKAFDAATTVKLGKLVGAEYVLTGAFSSNGGALVVDARLFSLRTGHDVLAARAQGDPNRVFDLEQELVAKVTSAIDTRVRRVGQGRTRVPSLESLVGYSRAIELADQGKVDEAAAAMHQVVSGAPSFLLARDRRQALLARLEEWRQHRAELLTDAALELAKLADQALAGDLARASEKEQGRHLAMRLLRGQFLIRTLRASLSTRDSSLRVALPGKEARVLIGLRLWLDNQRRFEDERARVPQGVDVALDAAELQRVELAGFAKPSPHQLSFEARCRLVLLGEAFDGQRLTIAPALAAVDAAERQATLEELDRRIATALSRAQGGAAGEAHTAVSLLELKGSALLFDARLEEAVAAYQQASDAFPAGSRAGWFEGRIRGLLTHPDQEFEKEARWRQAIDTCDRDAVRRADEGARKWLLRGGLPALDAMAAQLERACGQVPGLGSSLGEFYRGLAHAAATHGDCARAGRFWRQAIVDGMGYRSFDAALKHEPWCDYRITVESLPTKVRVTRVHAGFRDPRAPLLAEALAEVIEDELLARGVAVEAGGSHHGGTWGLFLSVEQLDGDDVTVRARLVRFGGAPDQDFLLSTRKGAFALEELFGPLMKELQGGPPIHGRVRNAPLSLSAALELGAALDLQHRRKWPEAQAAFEALARQSPSLGVAAQRAKMAARQQRYGHGD